MDALDGGGASPRECARRKAQRASVEGCSRGKIISWHLQPAAHKSTGAPGCHRKSPSRPLSVLAFANEPGRREIVRAQEAG